MLTNFRRVEPHLLFAGEQFCNQYVLPCQVQGTNDSSVVSKVSAAAQGYFHDDFLRHFVGKVSRRAPLINRQDLWTFSAALQSDFKLRINVCVWLCFLHRGYYVRWKAVDRCVKQFLCVTDACDRRQVGQSPHNALISVVQQMNNTQNHSLCVFSFNPSVCRSCLWVQASTPFSSGFTQKERWSGLAYSRSTSLMLPDARRP